MVTGQDCVVRTSVSRVFALRQRFKSGYIPPFVPLRPDPDVGPPIRREGKSRESERDLKRFTDYLYVERGFSTGTVKKYLRAVKRLKEWARRKRKSLPQLTTTDCRRWLVGVAKASPVTVSTINGMHCAANVFFRFLMTEGDLTTNPFEPIPYLPRDKTLPRFLSPEEVERLMRSPDISTYAGLLDRVVMELLYATGMRVAELVALRVDSIDLKKRRLLCDGKGGKQRFVIFGPNARRWLKRYLVARKGIPGARRSPYLFLKGDGKRLYGTFIWRHIKKHGLMAELKDVSPHILRHSFATHLRAGGASIRHIQELLGHEDMQSTEVYTHAVAEHLRKTYDQHHPRAGMELRPQHRKRGWHYKKVEEIDD